MSINDENGLSHCVDAMLASSQQVVIITLIILVWVLVAYLVTHSFFGG